MENVEIYGVPVTIGVAVDVAVGVFVDVTVGVEVASGVIFDCSNLINASSKPEGRRLLKSPACARGLGWSRFDSDSNSVHCRSRRRENHHLVAACDLGLV